MNALQKLKARIAETAAKASEGFEGGHSRGVSANIVPSEGFEGESGRGVSEIETPFEGFEGGSGRGFPEAAVYEKPLHGSPSKPSKDDPAQIEPFRCWVCLGVETPDRPLLPIMTSRPSVHRWMHGDECWNEHVRLCAAARTSARN